MKFLYAFLMSFTLVISLTCVKSEAKVTNLKLDRLTVEDGLSQGTIYQLMQDDVGFLWVASEAGVDIYDGHSVKRLKVPVHLESESVHSMMKDRNGLIWLNFRISGLHTFDPKTNVFTSIVKGDPQDDKSAINGIVEGENGDYWINTFKSLLHYDQSTGAIKREIDFSPVFEELDTIKSVFYHEKLLYLATSIGVIVYDIPTSKWHKLPNLSHSDVDLSLTNLNEANKIYNIYRSDFDEIFIGTNDGLFKLDVTNLRGFIDHGEPLPKYQSVLLAIETWAFTPHNNLLYIAGSQGLSSVDLTTGETKFYFGLSDDNDQITDNKIISLLIDKNEQFWLGSNATGVYKWNPKREQISNFLYRRNHALSLSNNEVWTIKQQKNSEVFWVGTSNGLNLLDTKSPKIDTFIAQAHSDKQYTSSHIQELSEDGQQRLWLTTGKGLKLFDIQTQRLLELPFSKELKALIEPGVSSAYSDNNTLWVVTYENVLKIDLLTGSFEAVTEISTKINVETIFQFLGYLPNSNDLIISTSEALWTFNTDTQTLNLLYKPEKLPSERWLIADSWAIDKNNIFWVAYTQKGLVGISLDDKEVKHRINNDNNKELSLNIYGLQADNDGDIWFSNHQGVHYLNADSLHIRTFSIDDGLPTTEFNSGAYSKTEEGKMLYGSMAGVSLFDPKILKQQKVASEHSVKFTHISTLSRSLNLPHYWDETKRIALNYDDIGVRFDFSTFSYNKTQTLFEYTLIGRKKVQFPLTKDNSITFPHLSSGNQTLEVRTLSPITGEYSQPIRVLLKVSYAPWVSPLAYTFYAIVIFSLLFFIYYKRQKQRKILLDAHEKVKIREKRLQLALVGSNSDVWEWQAKDNLMFGNRIEQELKHDNYGSSYPFSQHIKFIHPDDREQFLATWHNFIENRDVDDSFSCIYRMRHAEGEWLWYKDLGKIVSCSNVGEPIRVTGSYMNITQTRADEERAQYFGDAFRQTKDWVLIISENFTKVTANQSFRDVFKWGDEQNQFSPDLLGIERDRWLYYRRLLPTLKEGEFWRGEELITTDEKEEYHVLVNINVSRNESNKSVHYVCIFTDITAQKQAEKELRYLANYDHLTNLPNRSLLLERIKHAIDYSKRMSTPIALFFIDLDRFKQVNDSLGHDCGDLLLIEITNRLNEALRVDDTIARIGGDEFVVLLESFRGSAHLGKIAQKIINTVEQPVDLQGNIATVGASIGISLYPDDASNSDELMRNADVAMYQAKQIGRNTFQFFTPRMNYEADLRLEKETNLKLARANNEFINHYQPIIDSNTGQVLGAELLLRWQTKDKLLLPIDFIPLAEELKVIIPMTDGALAVALEDLARWRSDDPALYLSVNIPAAYLLDDGLLAKLKKMLKTVDLPLDALRLEITENTLFSEPERAIKAMQTIANEGVPFVLDDFGLGYSSLSFLKKLPIKSIKVDRSFVAGIGKDKADSAIIESILILAKNMDLQCIAVGVEKQAQLDFLQTHQCFSIQGFFFSEPVNAQAFSQYLQDRRIK